MAIGRILTRAVSRPRLVILTTRSTPIIARTTRVPTSRTMHIQSIPILFDNYAYLITDDATHASFVIDPAEPTTINPILSTALSSTSSTPRLILSAIVNTHHHNDHAGGNNGLRTHLKNTSLPIIGGFDCQSVTTTPADGEKVSLGENVTLTALYTPCHTRDSISWFAEDKKTGQRAVFTGDTLFIGGCGRFFEGTPEQMHKALNGVLAGLPDDTVVYSGHEYTMGNARFARSIVEKGAFKELQEVAEETKMTQGRYTIADEKKHNIFMLVEDKEVQEAVGETDAVKVMEKLRALKDKFQ